MKGLEIIKKHGILSLSISHPSTSATAQDSRQRFGVVNQSAETRRPNLKILPLCGSLIMEIDMAMTWVKTWLRYESRYLIIIYSYDFSVCLVAQLRSQMGIRFIRYNIVTESCKLLWAGIQPL